MSDDEALADYVRVVADQMLLRDWTIFVSSNPDDEPENAIDADRNACVECTFGRRGVSVWVNPEYWQTATPQDRRQTIAHELIHVHAHGAREVVAQIVTTHPRRTADALMSIWDVQMEYAIDALADVMAPTLPLPPKSKTKVK